MFYKKIVISICFVLLGLSLISNVNNFASAEFGSGDTVIANKTYENAYLAGGSLTVDGEVRKDLIGAGGTVVTNAPINRNLVASGGNVTVKSAVGGSIFVAGGTVIIDSSFVGGSVRVTGGTVTLSGNFSEDILVAGGDVILKNANVVGDVYVFAGNLTVQSSSIKGKIQGQYSVLEGSDLKSQVTGAIEIKKVDSEEYNNKPKNFYDFVNFPWELSVILITLITCWILNKRNRLSISSIKWGATFGKDILIGLAAFILPGIITIILLILQLFPLALLTPALVFLEIIAILLVLPIYVGNFIKNTWNLKLDIKWVIVIAYLILLVVSLLSSNIGALSALGLLSTIFALAHIGFMIRTGYKAANQYIAQK
jgi:hypothetical protein